jgi:hypothetical protein
MQDNLQIADVVETTTVAEPFELTVEQLQQVSGGVTATDVAAAGPHDNW